MSNGLLNNNLLNTDLLNKMTLLNNMNHIGKYDEQ